jgi:hypothetical protein
MIPTLVLLDGFLGNSNPAPESKRSPKIFSCDQYRIQPSILPVNPIKQSNHVHNCNTHHDRPQRGVVFSHLNQPVNSASDLVSLQKAVIRIRNVDNRTNFRYSFRLRVSLAAEETQGSFPFRHPYLPGWRASGRLPDSAATSNFLAKRHDFVRSNNIFRRD